MGTAIRLDDEVLLSFLKAKSEERDEIEQHAIKAATIDDNGKRLPRKMDSD